MSHPSAYLPVATADGDGDGDVAMRAANLRAASPGRSDEEHADSDSGSDGYDSDSGEDAEMASSRSGSRGMQMRARSRPRGHSSLLHSIVACARSLVSLRGLRRCRASVQRSLAPRRICAQPWSSLRALSLLLLYVLVCQALLIALLLYTPMDRLQGLHQSQRGADGDAYAALMDVHAAALRAKEAPLVDAATNPSRSVAAALLPAWQMALPPPPPARLDEPVSPPLNAQGLILPRLAVAPDPPPFAHTLPLDTAAVVSGANSGNVAAGSALASGAGSGSASLSSAPFYPLGPSFVIVTYVSSLYFPRLLNLLGSIHTWEPTQRVVVYDLGCSQQQIVQMQCMENVEVRPFNFSAFPVHVTNLFQYYFKPLLIYDALQHASSVLCLDAGQELRQDLRSIKALLQRDGYFFGSQPSNTVGRKTAAQTFEQLGVSAAQYDSLPFCGAAMFGIVRSAPAYSLLGVPAATCALRPSCHAPAGAGRSDHNFDQSTYSILVYKHGMRCAPQRMFREMDMSRCPLRPDRFVPVGSPAAVVLCMRRWHEPKPFGARVRNNQACVDFMQRRVDDGSGDGGRAQQSQQQSSAVAAGSTPMLQMDVPSNWMYAVPSSDSSHLPLQHTQSSHLQGDSPLVRCLRLNNNAHANCTREIREHEQRMERERSALQFRFLVDHATTMVWAGMRMPAAYLLFAVVAVAALWAWRGRRWIKRHGGALVAVWIAVWTSLRIVVAIVDYKDD